MKICKKAGCFGEPIDDYCEKHTKSKSIVKPPEKKKKSLKPKIAKLATDTDTFQWLVRQIGEGHCVTCKYVFQEEDRKGFCHAGHCIQRGRHATRLLFVNCHTQCARCNSEQNGNTNGRAVAHANFINRRYALFVEELALENPYFKGKFMTEILEEMSVPATKLRADYRRDMKEILTEGKKMLKDGWDKKDIREELIRKQKKFILEFFEKLLQ